jgi:hypothetical protein
MEDFMKKIQTNKTLNKWHELIIGPLIFFTTAVAIAYPIRKAVKFNYERIENAKYRLANDDLNDAQKEKYIKFLESKGINVEYITEEEKTAYTFKDKETRETEN